MSLDSGRRRANPTPANERVRFPGEGEDTLTGEGSVEALVDAYAEARAAWIAERTAAEDALTEAEPEDEEELRNILENTNRYVMRVRYHLTKADLRFFMELIAACYASLPEEIPAKNLFVSVNASAGKRKTTVEGIDGIVLSNTHGIGSVRNFSRPAKPVIEFVHGRLDQEGAEPGLIVIHCVGGRGDKYFDYFEMSGWRRREIWPRDILNRPREERDTRDLIVQYLPPTALVDSMGLMNAAPNQTPDTDRFVRWHRG